MCTISQQLGAIHLAWKVKSRPDSFVRVNCNSMAVYEHKSHAEIFYPKNVNFFFFLAREVSAALLMWTSSSSIFYVSYNAKFLQVILAFKIKFYLLPVKLFEKSCHIYSYRAVHLKKCENNKITRIHIFVVETFLYNKYSIYGSPNVIWLFLK